MNCFVRKLVLWDFYKVRLKSVCSTTEKKENNKGADQTADAQAGLCLCCSHVTMTCPVLFIDFVKTCC